MRISEMLIAMAEWLESSDNEAILLAEHDDKCLTVVAQSCVDAASSLRKAANQVDDLEPQEDSKITPESLDELKLLADALDASGNEKLIRQASVIDELLLTIAAPPNAKRNKLAESEKELNNYIEEYKKNKDLDDLNNISEAQKAIESSGVTKDYRILEAPLSTRYCPDHPGQMLIRLKDHQLQCALDKKVYDFSEGFKLENGNTVPGGDVAMQSKFDNRPMNTVFDTRESRLSNKSE
jgi:hypothetical protein